MTRTSTIHARAGRRAAQAALSAMVAVAALPAGAAWAGRAPAAAPAAGGREDVALAADPFRPTFDAAAPAGPAGRGATAAPIAPSVPALALPGSWPAVEVRTLLIGLHLLGLSFGLGGAAMLDFWILRWMRWGYLPDDVVRTFGFVGKAVSAGLVLLWLSGFGFLVLYGFADPAKLANPKILAKLAIVAALTLNGVVVHRLVLPYVARGNGLPLFDGFRRRRRLLFILSGALSGVSWYAAFALGLLREFNGRVPASTLLGLWLALVLLSTAALDVLLSLTLTARAPRAAERDPVG